MMEKRFIKATAKYSSLNRHIPAPYIRKSFELPFVPDRATVKVCGLGFYLLYVNGKEITKGYLAPYISNPDDYCYYDTYDLLPYLKKGKNAIGLVLGNGFMNSLGGYVWDVDKSAWRGAPRLALELEAWDGETEFRLTADRSFRVNTSPICFDDLHYGEYYDARCEIAGWSEPTFDDRKWKHALEAGIPRGELRECHAEPIRVIRTVKPERVFKSRDGYIYDFGVNSAGICKLHLANAKAGQQLTFRYAEQIRGEELYVNSVVFPEERYPDYFKNNQKDIYIAKGDPVEEWNPHFTYHGFRYVQIEGLTEEQATDDLLEFLVLSSDLQTVGGFSCSDETANTLFRMVWNSDRSNFFYYPTDCPHREKNGWTGDGAFSCFHMMMLYQCEASFCEWLANIRKSQDDRGALPGIVPTAGWGYDWGNGPAWDSVAFCLPYVVWKYRGNTEVIRENAHMMFRYLQYIRTRRAENGTIAVGLGDWASVGRRFSRFETPLEVTDSILVMDIAKKAAEMFAAIGYGLEAEFAESVSAEMRETIRRELLDTETATLKGRTQTAQAMGLYYGVFNEDEKQKAFAVLLDLIHEKNNSFDCGVLGMLSIFHVLSNFGASELAWKMITKKEYPSYGHLIEIGETTLPERFMPDGAPNDSHNHHFFGDIARWFIREVAGLRVQDWQTVTIRPSFLSEVDFAEAFYDLPAGRVSVKWKRENGKIRLNYRCPETVRLTLAVDDAVICRREDEQKKEKEESA